MKKFRPGTKQGPSSELSESSSDDDLSDIHDFVQITKNLDPKTKIFITKLLEDLESVQAELATRDDDLLEQEKMYIACKEALVLERSDVGLFEQGLGQRSKRTCSHEEGKYFTQ